MPNQEILTVDLPSILDRAAAAKLAEQLRPAVAAGSGLALRAGDVVQIGQCGLQLLLSAARSTAAAGTGFRIEGPSAEFQAALDVAGLRAPLADAITG